MSLEIRPPSGAPTPESKDPSLSPGDRITAKVVKAGGEGKYTLNISGREIEAISRDTLNQNPARLTVLKTHPILEVALSGKEAPLKEGEQALVKVTGSKDGLFYVVINGKEYKALITPPPVSARFSAEVLKSWPLLELKPLISGGKEAIFSIMAKEMASFNQIDAAAILRNFGGAKITAFIPEEIRRIIKDGGLFFENKLLKGVSAKGDAKLAAYVEGNDGTRDAITKTQIANILMNDDFFSFFEGDDLDFEGGVLRFSKSSGGETGLFMKAVFSNLGETVVSFAKAPGPGYYITVRTKDDISEFLKDINILGCTVNWRELTKKDAEKFLIKKEDLKGFTGFDVVG